MFQKLILIAVVFGLSSCTYFKSEEVTNPEHPIAKVNDVYLYKKDIEAILPKNYKSKDSALMVQNYITSWAKKQLLLHKASLNLNDEIDDINQLVQKYKEDLLIDKYRSAVVKQNLDTVVSEADIDTFYTKNKETLKLNEKLLMVRFIRVDKNIIHRTEIEQLFQSQSQKDLDSLMDKELEFKSFYMNDSVWVKYSDVRKEIPSLNNEDIVLVNNTPKIIKKENDTDLFLIKINKILNRNAIAPKDYVKPTIKQMILHTRKLKLLKKIESTLLNDANKNGQYEIYN